MAVTIARTAWIDDDGSGTTGTVLNNAIKTELYNQIDAALAGVVPGTGAWTAMPSSAANFTANTGTWTVEAGDVGLLQSAISGKVGFVQFNLTTTSLSTSATILKINLPAGWFASGTCWQPCWVFDQTAGWIMAMAAGVGTQIFIARDPSGLGGFAASTNNTSILGAITISLA